MSLTVSEAAKIVGCGARNIQSALKSGRLKGELIDGRWSVPESEAYRALIYAREQKSGHEFLGDM